MIKWVELILGFLTHQKIAMSTCNITSPDDLRLDELCDHLTQLGPALDRSGDWPAEQLRLCGEYGVYQWFLEPQWGGQGWSELDVIRGYLRLSAACLTTTFILTQRSGACRRIAASTNERLKASLLPDLAAGRSFATVGISHLTTSRRHLREPVLRARPVERGYVLSGFSPWVTGAAHAETVVLGATLPDRREILVALPMDLPGANAPAPPQLVGLTSSHTGPVEVDEVEVGESRLVAGPVENVMSSGSGAGTGGLQTSTLAIGLARAAIDFVFQEAEKRPELNDPAEKLRRDHAALEDDLLQLAMGKPACSTEQLRQRANSLATRAAQAALSAAKGAGYVVGHPAGRWCREALFFLVWSCPQPVMQANLCELAGLE